MKTILHKIAHILNMKHIIVAKDKETGEQRQFIFYGDWYNGLLVEEVFRPMTDGEKEPAYIEIIKSRLFPTSKN